MKKIYLSLLSVIYIGSMFASAPNAMLQKKNNGHNKLSPIKIAQPYAMRNGTGANHTASVIWSDDFSVPSHWTIAHQPGTFGDWVIGTNPPSGPFAISPIASTSSSNGFALFDSDLMCDTINGQIGNLTTTTPINCAGHSAVRLVFQEYYERYHDSTYVYVSNNGSTWTLFPVNSTFANNQACATNPATVILDVSSVAANQATVYVRFTFYSPVALGSPGTPAGCAYSWMVDDVSLEDIPSNDVAMVNKGFPSEYTLIPLSQVQPLSIHAYVRNSGGGVATNVGTQLDIYRFQSGIPTNVYSNISATVASVNPGDTINVLAGTYTPNDTGVYLLIYTSQVSGVDADMTNDSLLRYFVVDDSTYGRDYTPITAMLDNSLGAINNNPISLGQVYDIVSSAVLTSVSFYLAAPTLNNTVSCSVYSVTGSVPSTTALATTPVYQITASDTGGAFITLGFSSPVSMTAGQQYLVAVNQLLNDSLITLGFTNDIFTPNKAFYRFAGAWATIEAGGFPGVFVIEPSFQTTVGISENTSSGNLEIYPNPSNGIINIINKGNNKDYTVNVFNPVGQLVYSGKYNQLSKAVINLSSQTAGVYSIRFECDKELITKTFVISDK